MLRTFKFKRLDDMAFFLFDPGFSNGPESPLSAMPSKSQKTVYENGLPVTQNFGGLHG
jgi:hypothetical protein